MLDLHLLKKLYSHHQELYELYLVSLCSLQHETKTDLLMTVLISGTPQIGKSFWMKNIEEFCIPGTTDVICRQSAAANCVDANQDGLVKIFEEAPEKYIDESHPEASQIKNIHTSGKMTVDRSIPVKGGRYKSARSEARLRIAQILLTNDELRRLREGYTTRYYVKCVPSYSNDEILSSAPGTLNQYEREFVLDCQITQMLVGLIELNIVPGRLPPVFMRWAEHLFDEFKRGLKSWGFEADDRAKARFFKLLRIHTIKYAIDMVFRRPGFFEVGDEFNEDDVLQCAPFLIVTDEIFLFALTMHSGLFVDPLMDGIVRCLRMKAPMPLHNADIEYLDLTVRLKKNQEPLAGIAEELARCWPDKRTKVEPYMIERALSTLKTCSLGGLTVLKVDERKVFILNSFLAKFEPSGIMVSLIKGMCHEATSEKNILLGTSRRSDADFRPFIFNTFEMKPNRERQISIPNPKYVDPMAVARYNLHVSNEAEGARFKMPGDTNLADYYFGLFKKSVGLPQGLDGKWNEWFALNSSPVDYEKHYPDLYVVHAAASV